VPTEAKDGEILLIKGVTVKFTPLLPVPLTVTVTEPVLAPTGTAATMLVLLQLFTAAGVPLKLTVLVPWVDPKPDPVIVTAVPTAPEVGERLVILGPAARAEPAQDKIIERKKNSVRTGFVSFRCMNVPS